jgi:hypothetical protein
VVRRAVAGLAGVEESTSYGGPAWKVKKKLICCQATNKQAEPGSLVVRVDFETRDALIAEAPDTYYVKPHYVNYECVLVRLARVEEGALRDLLRGSWRYVTKEKGRGRGV